MPFHQNRQLSLGQARKIAKIEKEMASREQERKGLVKEINQLRFKRSKLGKFAIGLKRFGKGTGKALSTFSKGLNQELKKPQKPRFSRHRSFPRRRSRNYYDRYYRKKRKESSLRNPFNYDLGFGM